MSLYDGDFFVSPNGDDNNAGTEIAPFKTIAKAMPATSQQARWQNIWLRGGTYTLDADVRLVNPSVSAGTVSGAFPRVRTLAAFNNEPVTIMPESGTNIFFMDNPGTGESSCYSIEVRDVILDGTNITGALVKAEAPTSGSGFTNRPRYVRFRNVEFKNGPMHGCHVDVASHFEWINCKFHDLGTTTSHHALFFHSKNHLIEGCDFGEGITGYGIEMSLPSSSLNRLNDYIFIDRNLFHDMDWRAVHVADGGDVYPTHDFSVRFMNNIIHDCADTALVIARSSSLAFTISPFIFHNTIVRNGGWGIDILSLSSRAKIYSNIVFGNTLGAIQNGGSLTDHLNASYPNITTDPKFIDYDNNDFRIQVNSPAVKSGSRSLVDISVQRDYRGVTRGHRGFLARV